MSLPAATVFVRSRVPTLVVPQVHGLEPGIQFALHDNHRVAPNGDARGGYEDAIDYDSARVGPLRMFPGGRGELSLFGGEFGVGGFAEAGAINDPARGFGRGPFARGAFGVGHNTVSWRGTQNWRDGKYQIALRLLDHLGNAAETPAASEVVRVEALPREASGLRLVGVADGNAQFVFNPSPEFEPEE